MIMHTSVLLELWWSEDINKIKFEQKEKIPFFLFFFLNLLGELEKADKSLYAQELAYFLQLYQLV